VDKPAPLQTVFPHGLLNFCTADFDQNHGTRFRDPSANIIAGHDRHLQYMTTEVEIRRATAGDAEAVYEIVLRALRETNARDYPASVIDRLVLTLPEGVASKLEEWQAYVAVVDGRIVGTGSLSGKTVRAVFVHPDYQGRGIGTKLMDAVENAARGKADRGRKKQAECHECPSHQTFLLNAAFSPRGTAARGYRLEAARVLRTIVGVIERECNLSRARSVRVRPSRTGCAWPNSACTRT